METRMDPRMEHRRKTVQEGHARRSYRRLVRVLGVLALAAAVVWAFRSPLLAVQHIEVTGAHTVDVTAVVSRQGIKPGVPMMDVDLDSAVTRLLADPWVAHAEARRSWPQTVLVEVVERVPVAWVSAEDGWHEVAADGVSLVTAGQPDVGEPAIIFPAATAADLVGDRDLVGLLEFVTTLPTQYGATTSVSPDESGFVARVAGYKVRLGSGNLGREKALALMAVLETVPEQGSVITVVAPSQPALMAPGAAESDPAPSGEDDNPEDG